MVRIFLAEDNFGDVLLVKQALKEHQIKHELHVAQDGAEALEFVTRIGQPGGPPCPDVLLLDLNLPEAGGPEILTEFRRHPDCEQIPAIIVTSSNSPRDRSRMAELHISHYFCKPSDFTEFMRLGEVIRDVVPDLAA